MIESQAGRLLRSDDDGRTWRTVSSDPDGTNDGRFGVRVGPDEDVRTAVFGVSILAVAVAPTLWPAVAALVVVGAAGTSFLAFSNAVLQLHARPEMRARVLALRAVAFLGMRPIGGPIVGAIGEHVGPRYGVGVGALATLLIAMWAGRGLTRMDEPAPEEDAAST